MARRLGLAGLLPQIAVVATLLSGDLDWRFSALATGYAYAVLILSFLGGLWWGVAARGGERTPAWLWVAAVAPSLIGLASAWPWATGGTWPGPSLIVIGLALIAALGIDLRVSRMGLCPPGWMALRTPLSLGLGLLTIATAAL